MQSGSTGSITLSTVAGSVINMISGIGELDISNDAVNTTIKFGANTSVKNITLGSTDTSSSTTVQSGSGVLNFTVSNRPINIDNGTGNLGVSTDASNTTVNIGNVAVVKTVTLGSINGASATTLQAGTGGLFATRVFGVTVGISGVAVVVDNTGQLGTVVSSVRYKENIEDMGSVSSSILNLRPTTFSFKNNPHRDKSFGLIAEEVEPIAPYLVVYNQNNEVESVKYHELPALLLNELQKLLKRIEFLEAKLIKSKMKA